MDYKYNNQDSVLASRYLDTVGDGSGDIDLAVNGSVTPVDFKAVCPADRILIVNSLTTLIIDTGTFDTGAYGNGIALTNGIRSIAKISGVEYDRTEKLPIKTNIDWSAYHFNLEHITFGAGDEALSAKYLFDRDGQPLVLYPGDEYIIRVMDDLTGLTRQTHRAGIHCYELPQ